MNPIIDSSSRLALNRLYRLQWEAAQNAHVLLFPEGMVRLNASAGEILKRCDGLATLADITAELERAYSLADLSNEVKQFVLLALEKQWLKIQAQT